MRASILAGAFALASVHGAPVNSTEMMGTDLTNGTVVSVPFNGTNTGTSSSITGNNAKDGTNYTLAAPFTPAGGDQQTNPSYHTYSNFDFQSLNLALNQELIELDLFHNGLAKFSVEDFEAAGLTAADRAIIEFMANQEVGHALAVTNLIGPERAAKQCVYQYPFTTVPEFILFCQLLTRFGESGVYGFLPHLDSRPSAQILLQSITTVRPHVTTILEFPSDTWSQLAGGSPADDLPSASRSLPHASLYVPTSERFETGVPQSYAWTLLSPYIKSCPSNNPHIEWQNFPALHVTNQPYALGGVPAVSTNRTLSAPGRVINFSWEEPGKIVGYDDLYKTSTVAGAPKFAAFISQLNVTYAPLFNIVNNTGSVYQPGFDDVVYPTDPQVNGTMFISLVDAEVNLTPYNISLILNHTVAGPALYQSG
ncbi:hypothetical protein P7C70_g8321, partial [Phenoliferia sp. Uapishka_3]